MSSAGSSTTSSPAAASFSATRSRSSAWARGSGPSARPSTGRSRTGRARERRTVRRRQGGGRDSRGRGVRDGRAHDHPHAARLVRRRLSHRSGHARGRDESLHAPGASPRSGGPARLHAIRRARDGLPHGRPAEGGRRPPPCPGEGLGWWERPRDRSKRRQRRPAKHPVHRRVPASRGHSRRRPRPRWGAGPTTLLPYRYGQGLRPTAPGRWPPTAPGRGAGARARARAGAAPVRRRAALRAMRRRVRVLIVEGSAVTRRVLSAILAADRELEVAGAVAGVQDAHEAMARLRPDVVTLDAAILSRRGLASLERLMRASRTPVVLVSPPTRKGREMTLLALDLGAAGVVRMPSRELVRRMPDVVSEMLGAVKAAARGRTEPDAATAEPSASVIAVGASTGGTDAIQQFLMAMRPDAPGLVIVQHMPERFTHAFAERCNGLCPVRVREATDGDLVRPGHALIAPGNLHMRVRRDGQGYRVLLEHGPPVNGHRPSIDVLFTSTAAAVGRNAVGVILTGMGADGARGLSAMKRAGARTLAQDEASCVVFGMPREAIALGAVDHLLPLSEIGRAALALSGPGAGGVR